MIKKPPQSIHLPSSLLVDPTKEPLKILQKPYFGIKEVPSELGNNDVATMVFIELNRCFEKAGFVAEGLLGNIIWGFEQCGYDPRHVAAGLTKLRALNYIYYSDELGNRLSEVMFDAKKPIWIRYGKKFTDLIVREKL